MKAKLAFLTLMLGVILISSPIVHVAGDTATIKYSDGLKVGDKLTYVASVDDTFNADSGMNVKDGDKTVLELTSAFEEVTGTFSEIIFPVIEFVPTGEWKITYQNGTVEENSKADNFFVAPTTIELGNGTTLTGSDAIALATGLFFFGFTESDGNTKFHYAFGLTFDLVYSTSTGILQSLTVLDSDGEGEIALTLSDESNNAGLPAFDTYVFFALASTFAVYAILRRRK